MIPAGVACVVAGTVALAAALRRDTAVERRLALLAKGAKAPRSIDACALLSPFDPVVWFRPRAERLYDFRYRIGIYTPGLRTDTGDTSDSQVIDRGQMKNGGSFLTRALQFID